MSDPVSPRLSADLAPVDGAPDEAAVIAALERFQAAVRARYGALVSEILLFGSRARGDHRPDSDVDLLVVFKDQQEPDWVRLRTLSDIAFDALLETGVRIQPMPVTRAQMEASPPSAFLARALADGRALS